jgi:hypothetical protein
MGMVTLKRVFSEYFGFPCQFSFYNLLHTHLSPAAGTLGQLVAGVPSGFSLTLSEEMKNKYVKSFKTIFTNRCREFRIEQRL